MSFLHDVRVLFRFSLHCEEEEVSVFLKEITALLLQKRGGCQIGVIGGYSLLCHLKEDQECSSRCVYGLSDCFCGPNAFVVPVMAQVLQKAGVRLIYCRDEAEIHLALENGLEVAVEVSKGTIRQKGEELQRLVGGHELSRIAFVISTLGYCSASEAFTEAMNELTSCLHHQPLHLLVSADAVERVGALPGDSALIWTITDPKRALKELSSFLAPVEAMVGG